MAPANGITHLDATPATSVAAGFPVDTDEELGVGGRKARFRAARRDREADGRLQGIRQLGRVPIHAPDRHVPARGRKLTNLRPQESKPGSDGLSRPNGVDGRGLVTLHQTQLVTQGPWPTLDRVEGSCLLMTRVPGRGERTFAVPMNLRL